MAVVAHRMYLRFVCCPQNKWRLFPYTVLIDCFLNRRRDVYCAVRTQYLNQIQFFVFICRG